MLDAAKGCVRTAVLEAAPGLGRSALLDQVAIDAQLAGCTVLRAQGSAHARAFGVANALVRAGLAMHPWLDGPSASVLPQVSQEANAGPAATPVDAVQRHARTLTAMQAFLVEIGQQASLAILIDTTRTTPTPSRWRCSPRSRTARSRPPF